MKLAQYLSDNKITQLVFAEKVGVSQVTINRYVKGERFPDFEMIEKIFQASDKQVTVTDWYQQAAEDRAAKSGQAA
ncbi:MAG: helix-turn-helix transcriptional regulator [Mesorhizobium sp.]|nr:MAG: helix-turn-helix transcriptional regulator [Mesorhizobium sp.]